MEGIYIIAIVGFPMGFLSMYLSIREALKREASKKESAGRSTVPH